MKKIIFMLVTISCFVALMTANINLNGRNDKNELELKQIEALATIEVDDSGVTVLVGYDVEWKYVPLWVDGKLIYEAKPTCIISVAEARCPVMFP